MSGSQGETIASRENPMPPEAKCSNDREPTLILDVANRLLSLDQVSVTTDANAPPKGCRPKPLDVVLILPNPPILGRRNVTIVAKLCTNEPPALRMGLSFKAKEF
jgi:hypothetical protein